MGTRLKLSCFLLCSGFKALPCLGSFYSDTVFFPFSTRGAPCAPQLLFSAPGLSVLSLCKECLLAPLLCLCKCILCQSASVHSCAEKAQQGERSMPAVVVVMGRLYQLVETGSIPCCLPQAAPACPPLHFLPPPTPPAPDSSAISSIWRGWPRPHRAAPSPTPALYTRTPGPLSPLRGRTLTSHIRKRGARGGARPGGGDSTSPPPVRDLPLPLPLSPSPQSRPSPTSQEAAAGDGGRGDGCPGSRRKPTAWARAGEARARAPGPCGLGPGSWGTRRPPPCSRPWSHPTCPRALGSGFSGD